MTAPRQPRVEIVSFETYADASGAPAVIRVGSLTYGFDFLGEVRRRGLVVPYSTTRGAQARALRRATAAYQERIDALGPEWLAANRAMYAD